MDRLDVKELTEDQIVDELYRFYEDQLVIDSVDEFSLWEWAFSNMLGEGHTNNQHFYPDRWLKMFGKATYNLNCRIVSGGLDRIVREPVDRVIRDGYSHLYSRVGIWSKDLEAWFTRIEGICLRIMNREGLVAPERLVVVLSDRNERLVRVSFFLLTWVNVLRAAVANDSVYDNNTGRFLDADGLFNSRFIMNEIFSM
jgi:hypothetical protein